MSTGYAGVVCVAFGLANGAAGPVFAQSFDLSGDQILFGDWGNYLSETQRLGVRVLPRDAGLNFSQGLEHSALAGMVIFRANQRQYGLTFGYQHMGQNHEAPTGTELSIPGRNRISSIGTVLGEFQIAENQTMALWAGGGFRYWGLSTVLNAPATQPDSNARSEHRWFDPMFGIRGRTHLTDRWFATGWAYTGGFGMGSQATLDVLGGVGYEFTQTLSGMLGYRYLSVESSEPNINYDAQHEGIMAGISFNF